MKVKFTRKRIDSDDGIIDLTKRRSMYKNYNHNSNGKIFKIIKNIKKKNGKKLIFPLKEEKLIKKPLKIVSCQEVNDVIFFELEWKKSKKYKKKPRNSWISTLILSKVYPCLIINYYEAKLKFITKTNSIKAQFD